MKRLIVDLDKEGQSDITADELLGLVKKLLSSRPAEAKKILSTMEDKNDLADLDEEMHGTPNTPEVTDDDLPEDDKPKKKGRG
jgi:hypothetical protein